MDGMGGDAFGPGPIPGLPEIEDQIKEIQKVLEKLKGQLQGKQKPELIGDYLDVPWRPPIMETDIDSVRDRLDRDLNSRFPRNISIRGVEATQSTQYFFFNNVGSNASSDNMVPLIAGKDLLLRVYVESDRFAGLTSITGEVVYGSKRLKPINGPLLPTRASTIRRERLNDTLNFRIPRADCRGSQTFFLYATDTAKPSFFNTSRAYRIDVEFREIPNVRVFGVMINFTGNRLNLPSPNGFRLVDTLARFVPMLPFPGFDYGPCVVRTYNQDLTQRSGWDAMLNEVANIRDTSDNKGIYAGLLPTNTSGQVGTGTRGIGRYGVCISQQDDTRAMGHEFGHALGLNHVSACGEGDTIDTKYPTYASYMQGSIGEVGVNLSRMETHDPATDWDFMTYCDNPNVLFPPDSWVSPYTYMKMMSTARKSNGMTSGFGEAGSRVRRMVLNARVYRSGRVELLPSYAVTTTRDPYDPRPTLPVVLDIYARDGGLVTSHVCHVPNLCGGHDDEAYTDIHEVVDWQEGIDRVVVVREKEELATFDVRENAMRPSVASPRLREGEERAGTVGLEWDVSESHDPVHFLVRYSNDGGETWQTLATGLEEPRFVTDLETLPGGEKCLFEVTAASGLSAVSAYSEPFEVRRKPRQVYIVSPQDGEVFYHGEPVTFAGGAYSPDFGVSSAEETRWESSIDGYLGSGHFFSVDSLSPGQHRISIQLRDGLHGEASAAVYIEVKEAREKPC